MTSRTPYHRLPMALWATTSFLLLSPLATYGLLLGKGLPSFAVDHLADVLVWVYQVTWQPALGSGLMLAAVLAVVQPWAEYFIRPYDFGRCFSLGAVAGAVLEALATWGYRALSHHPFSSFWIAGAMISGAIAAAAIVPVLLYAASKSRGASF